MDELLAGARTLLFANRHHFNLNLTDFWTSPHNIENTGSLAQQLPDKSVRGNKPLMDAYKLQSLPHPSSFNGWLHIGHPSNLLTPTILTNFTTKPNPLGLS